MELLKNKFKQVFGHQNDPQVYFSPGRVNLIGEHIDYNGGYVFPAAINLGTYGVCAKREDLNFRMFSEQESKLGMIEVSLDTLDYNKNHEWANYVKGVIKYLKEHQFDILFGYDLYIDGNLPTASGLSSSASLEVLIVYIANDIYGLNLSRAEMALIAQSVENDYMGMHCGIMDQLSIACGVKDHALLMNTATLEMKPMTASFEGYVWVIMNTKYPRKTTDSKYNERRHECEMALKKIQTKYTVAYLCDLKPENLPNIKELLNDALLYKRVKHVITEQDRTLRAMEMMQNHDPIGFADLLNQSHESLKTDYEVTGLHLDSLCEAARRHGAIGARVTGAGFGGCAIALVESNQAEHMKQEVKKIYLEKTSLHAEFYSVTFEDGVQEVK